MPRLFSVADISDDQHMQKTRPLSPKAIEKFRALYREEFGEEISDEEAANIGFNLLAVLKILIESPHVLSIHNQPN